ncbi:MAG TPA: hypothetical protein VKQ31_00275 [Steroidobacteraceae bacterium]|nr:hypothetical protein [Steroidobacteraceae bacterium]
MLAFFRLHHPPPSAAQPAAPSAPATTEAPAAEGSLSSGFKWSGLSPDQIRDARSALDLAIAREEQTAHAPAGNAATKDQLGAAPNGTKDGVRL